MPRLQLGLPGEVAGEFEDAGGAGGVIVGAVVNGLAGEGRHGICSPMPEMVVVGAEDDVLVGLAGQEGADVGDVFAFPLDVRRRGRQ